MGVYHYVCVVHVWLLQYPNQTNADMHKVMCEASGHLRNKKRECLKGKIKKYEIDSK
jgi:hypothetical protein